MPVDAIEMSVEKWIDVPENPRQRNTEKRANYARLHHLREYSPIHRFVFAATIGGDIACKLDGHTRALLWKLGELERPPSGKVVTLLVAVRSMADAKRLYDQCDARSATKKPSDVIFGATRENDFRLSSSLLRGCKFSDQLRIASGRNNINHDLYALVRTWKPHLIALDGMALTSNYTILIAAMLLAIRRDGVARAGEFFATLDQNKGTKTAQGMDGPEALRQHIDNRRAQGSTAGYENLDDILARAWSAYVQWLDGTRIKALKSRNDIWDVIKEFSQIDNKKAGAMT
jgi:hypothetical protein